MSQHSVQSSIATALSAAYISVCLLPAGALAGDRPQEVLDLIAGHNALAMKIRPLQDRVLTAAPKEDSPAFQPEGAPIRAKTESTGEKGAEKRIPARLTHRERSATAGDEYGRIKIKLAALDKKARAERERVNRPNFGVGLRSAESGDVRFGDGQHGARPPTGNPGSGEVGEAIGNLASLEQELAAIERELSALEKRNRAIYKKPGRTTYSLPD